MKHFGTFTTASAPGASTRVFSLLVLSAMGVAPAAFATTIPVTSYSYTGGTPAGEPGNSAYDDPTDTKLTNGLTGTTTPTDGSWVGWQAGDSGAAQITFHFASSVTITQVSLDFLRNDNANTQLPTSVQIGSTIFPVTDFANDLTQDFVTFTGSWTGSQIVVTLDHPTSNWVFVNEATFTGAASSTPEPATFGLFGVALLGLCGLRSRRLLP
jgi:hypothetical protein